MQFKNVFRLALFLLYKGIKRTLGNEDCIGPQETGLLLEQKWRKGLTYWTFFAYNESVFVCDACKYSPETR